VFVARHKATASLYALKKIPKETIKQHMMEDQLILEIKLQAYLNHQNILKLYTFFADEKHIYLVLEYME
jgi:serine/threonine protein kinase